MSAQALLRGLQEVHGVEGSFATQSGLVAARSMPAFFSDTDLAAAAAEITRLFTTLPAAPGRKASSGNSFWSFSCSSGVSFSSLARAYAVMVRPATASTLACSGVVIGLSTAVDTGSGLSLTCITGIGSFACGSCPAA